MKHVKDIMTPRPAYCTTDTPLPEVAGLMVHFNCGEIPVVGSPDDLKPVGVITDRDIVCRTIARSLNPMEMKAGDCMSSPAVMVTPDTRADDCCNIMEKHEIRRVPVIDKAGRLCGIVSQADIARSLPVAQKSQFVESLSRPEGKKAA